MKSLRSAIIIVVLFVSGVVSVSAETREEYNAFAEETRDAVYNMDLPAFNVRDIPECYKEESAVYVAVYNELDARKKTGFGHLPGTLRFSRKARVEGGELRRVLIFVNDRAARDRFSEFDFATDMKKKMSNAHRKERTVMGVRLIKPDGRTIDISTDEFVDVEEGKNGKEKRRKLAVPGLETGDMLDVFFYTEHKLQNVHLEPFTFYLRDEFPVMDYEIHAVLDDNLTSQYRTLHGAPDFKISRDEDKNYVLDLKVKDIPGVPRLWYNAAEQSPQVKLLVFNRRSDAYTPNSARKDGLQTNPPAINMIEDLWSGRGMMSYYIARRFVNDKLKNGDKAYKSIGKMLKEGKIDTLEAGDYIYNLLSLAYFVSDDDLYPIVFDSQLCDLLRETIKGGVVSVVTSDVEEEPIDSLISMFNATTATMIRGDKRFYLPPRAIMAPSEIHPDFIGRKAQVYNTEKYRKKYPEVDTVFITLPRTSAADNRNVTEVDAKINGTMLDVHRKESYLGSTKIPFQTLLTEEEIIDAYLAYLNRYDVELSIKEKSRKATDRAGRYATAKEKRVDEFKDEIKLYHGDDLCEYVDGRIEQVGIDPISPEMVYALDYEIDGVVKRAGNNILLSVGRLLSTQTEVTDQDRRRRDEALMSSPREFITNIRIAIPAGYKVSDKSLDALRRNVEDETGEFCVTADVKDGVVSISVIKRYKNRFIPVAQWDNAIKTLEAALLWRSSSILFEKK